MSIVRIVGIVLAVLGVVATVVPGWFGPLTRVPPPPAEVYALIESRVRGGMVLGVGLILIAVTSLRPWSSSIPSAIVYFMAGALVSRLFGIVVDGAVPRQWLLVAVETGVMTLAALWLWRAGAAGG